MYQQKRGSMRESGQFLMLTELENRKTETIGFHGHYTMPCRPCQERIIVMSELYNQIVRDAETALNGATDNIICGLSVMQTVIEAMQETETGDFPCISTLTLSYWSNSLRLARDCIHEEYTKLSEFADILPDLRADAEKEVTPPIEENPTKYAKFAECVKANGNKDCNAIETVGAAAEAGEM